MEKRVDFYKWVRELQGVEMTAWAEAEPIQKKRIEKASDRLNKLPVWTLGEGWMVGTEFYGKNASGGRRRKTKKSKSRSRKTRRNRK